MTARFVIQATEALARQTEEAQDRLLGYPKAPGAMLGGGVVVSIAESWNGDGEVPYGWSSYLGSSITHPTLPLLASVIDSECATALVDGRQSRLTAAQIAKLQSDIAGSVPKLPAEWGPIEPLQSQRRRTR